MKKDEFLHILDKLDILDSRLDSIVAELAARKPIIDKIRGIEEDVSALGKFHVAIRSIVSFLAFLAGGVGLFEYFRNR